MPLSWVPTYCVLLLSVSGTKLSYIEQGNVCKHQSKMTSFTYLCVLRRTYVVVSVCCCTQ